MTEDARRAADLQELRHLRDAAWRDFNARQAHEWKVALSLWTALAVFASLVITGRITLGPGLSWIPVGAALVVGTVLVVLHATFVSFIAASHDIAREKESFFEAALMERLAVAYPAVFVEKLEKVTRTSGRLMRRPHLFQLGITLEVLKVRSCCE